MPVRARHLEEGAAAGAAGSVAALRDDRKEPWIGRARNVVVPVVAVLAIFLVIYLLEDKPADSELPQEQPQASGVASGSAQPVRVTASGEELARTPAPRIGYPAPAFTLNNLDGKQVKLSDFQGQTVFLNFFASWCPPCRAEMPDILATYEENKLKGVVVVGVDLQEEAQIVRDYAGNVGLTFPIVLDRTGQTSALYRITAIPTSFFIDRDGVIREMQIGAMSKSLMLAKLKKAMPD